MGFIIAAAVAAAVIAFCFLCYKKAPPTQAIVVTGFGLSRPKVVCGRGVFVLPIVQRADRLNMRLLKIDVKTPETGVKTKEGVSLWLDSVVTVQVYSENSTVSDEEVRNAGYDDIRKYINSRQQAAISNFLGMDEAHINEKINDVLYESKLVGYPKPFKNKVRTFCQNPGGFVAQENYDNDLAVVNGHSYKELKSQNTNLAILCSHNFSVPFNQPIAYAQKVGELTNMLGDGHILVQRFGDILEGKRTWQKELSQSNLRPTLPDAVAGDITAAMPYRAMTNIINFIHAMDHVVPGFAGDETLLYSPELKFYSNRVKMDTDFNTNIQGLHCLGDSSGWTRGLMMASVHGVLMGRKLV